nr:immunoglobulin light chain junction region [Macaca mulatta]MOW74659.1 immunoglobulin light chain junction region [Macaca mulatta]
CVQGLQLPYSG